MGKQARSNLGETLRVIRIIRRRRRKIRVNKELKGVEKKVFRVGERRRRGERNTRGRGGKGKEREIIRFQGIPIFFS